MNMFTFFLWWRMAERKIFSRISFTGPKFNENLKNDHTFNNKLLIILKTYVHYYVIDLSTKNKMERRGFIFLQKSNVQTVGNRKKKTFFCYFISEIPNFAYMGFFRKCSTFRRSIPLTLNLKVHDLRWSVIF